MRSSAGTILLVVVLGIYLTSAACRGGGQRSPENEIQEAGAGENQEVISSEDFESGDSQWSQQDSEDESD